MSQVTSLRPADEDHYGLRVLGDGPVVPRRLTPVVLRLTDGTRAVAWARDAAGLRGGDQRPAARAGRPSRRPRRPARRGLTPWCSLVAAVVVLVAGVETSATTTGGLLVTPIRQLHLVGGRLLAGTAAGVAAVLTALAAVPALRAARAPADTAAPTPVDAPDPDEVPPHPAEADDADHATTSPESDRRS